jgi:hypothetical protein
MIVFASQHIYGSVQVVESPSKKAGYQTLFYTHAGLTAAEVNILEQHARCNATNETRKYQFYLLPSGKAVITQVMTLPDRDSSGKNYLFISHALVISADDYVALAKSPLGLFNPQHFFHRLEDAYTEGDIETGDIPQKKLVSPSAWEDLALKSAQNWNPEDLVRLVRFGWQAKRLTSNRKSVVFFGNTNSIFRSLAIIFLLTAPEKRHHLTFDTHMDGCTFEDQSPFWAWGTSPEEAAGAPYWIDVDQMQTFGELPPQHDTPIERWIAERSIPTRMANYITELDQTQLLAEMLDGQALRRDILINMDEEIVRVFTSMNPEAVVKLILSKMPKDLSQKLLDRIGADVRTAPGEYAIWASGGLGLEEKADYLFHLLLTAVKDEVIPTDRKILENLAAESKHTGLFSLVNLLSRDFNRWDRSLEYLPKESYHLIVQAVLSQNIFPASEILYPPHLSAWVSELKRPLGPGELKSVLGYLNKYRGQFEADDLLPMLKYLSDSDREQFLRWVQSYSGSAPQLRKELGVEDAEGNTRGSKFKNMFSRGKD